MKFIHTADLHLGKVVNGYSMLEDQIYALQQIKDYVKEHKPDALVLAGDIYDRAQPAATAIRMYSEFLREVLIDLDTPVLAIAGNHDGADFLEFGHDLFSSINYHVAGRYNGELKKVILNDKHGVVNFYLMPFADYEVVRHYLENEEIKSLDDATRETLLLNEVDREERNVMVTHNFVVNSNEDLIESDSEKRLFVGGKESVSASYFDSFDYVALGHLHRNQVVKSKKVCYSGSMLKYSFSEELHTKSVSLIEMDEKGVLDVSFLPIVPLRDVRTVKGTLAEVLDDAGKSDDYLQVILTDEGELIEPMAKLREVYPNVMTLRLERDVIRESDDEVIDRCEGKELSPEELFARFYESQRGEELGELRGSVVESIVKEVLQD